MPEPTPPCPLPHVAGALPVQILPAGLRIEPEPIAAVVRMRACFNVASSLMMKEDVCRSLDISLTNKVRIQARLGGLPGLSRDGVRGLGVCMTVAWVRVVGCCALGVGCRVLGAWPSVSPTR